MSMDPNVKKQWVDALRSGKYKQGKHHLANLDGTWCCLGVLADIAADAYWVKVKSCWKLKYGRDLATAFPPDKLLKDLGIKFDSSHINLVQFVSMNDSGDYTFAQIADAIEKSDL